MKLKYYIFNKPYNVLSQFTREAGNQSIADYFILDNKDIYPIGRLDKDSEGMLLLTNDKSLNAIVLSPKQAKSKTYLVQVEGQINKAAISKLCAGVTITVDQKAYHTLPAFAKIIDAPKYLWERTPPVRYRKDIPTSWVEVRIEEGKNRQVRKMLAEVGFPVLRLIRVAIQDLYMDRIAPGDIQEIERVEIMKKLKIK
ncbi:MAG: pseudouridine synthase [Chitinophagales bacterium]|nr:pseudouridine synthase [Bacteroidota bacterium]MCB9256175.1 pseudouridine synthase [Chitinophagales bacterium]